MRFKSELASGRDFFGIPNSESRSWGFGIGIFYFGLDRKIPKIPKSRESGSGFENPEKIPNEKSQKSRSPWDRDLFFRDIPGISRSDFYHTDLGFLPSGSGFFFVRWDIPTKSQFW